MTNQLGIVPFHGDTIYCVEFEGEPYAPVKPIVDNLGLDWSTQCAKLRNTPHFSCGDIPTTGKDGKTYNMLCIPLRKLTGFLYSINANKIKPSLKDKLLQYQNECDEVLWKYWMEGKAVRTTAPSGNGIPLTERINGAKLVFEAAHIQDNPLAVALDYIYQDATGISALKTANIALESPKKEVLLTPTQIGEALVPQLKAHKVNSLLQENGYQTKISDMWQPTEKGANLCVMLDVTKRHSKGTPVTQLKWYSSIVATLQEIINKQED